jgi:hypothetical protein
VSPEDINHSVRLYRFSAIAYLRLYDPLERPASPTAQRPAIYVRRGREGARPVKKGGQARPAMVSSHLSGGIHTRPWLPTRLFHVNLIRDGGLGEIAARLLVRGRRVHRRLGAVGGPRKPDESPSQDGPS